MTLSNDDRISALNSALVRMLEDLGENGFDTLHFEVEADRYRDLPQTTWEDLKAVGCVAPRHLVGRPQYTLTASGWICALKAAGTFGSPAQLCDAIKLKAALKGMVKGRPIGGAGTDLYVINGATGLKMEWIFNALQSRLLQHLWPAEHLDVAIRHGGREIRVPSRFGSNRLFGEAGPFPDP